MLSAFCLIAGFATAVAQPSLNVVPAVQSWTPGHGTFDAKAAAIIVSPGQSKAVHDIAESFRQDLQAAGCGDHRLVTGESSAPGSIILLGAGNNPIPPEGYRIEIGKEVVVRSPTPVGIYYGTRTLLQLLAQKPQEQQLPRGVIQDAPQYRHRMLMLDVGRKPFPMPVLKDYLRMMAWYKMNELHVHFSDEAFGGSYAAFRIQSEVFPGLAAKDFFYTKQDIRELQDFAKARGITPEFDMPGHARCFTDYWPDTMLKGFPNYMDVTNPKTIENLKKLLDEMIPLFDGPDIHIGTDEYRVGNRPDLHEAFRQFINTMNAHIRSRGKTCRIWSGFEHMKGTTEIDPTTIIDMWETDDAKGQIAKGHRVINSNHGRTYIVPGCHYYGISCTDIYQGWEPWMISADNAKNPGKDDPNLLGGKLHVWCDQGPTGYNHYEIADLTLPGLQTFAEKLWGTKGSKNYPEFTQRAKLTLPIPGVTVLNRLSPSRPDGVLLDLPQEQTLADTNSFIPLPLAQADRADLEYPWTLTMDVCPTADSGNRAVLLSSDLAEICAGSSSGKTNEVVTEFADGTKRRGKINTVGVGTVRAAGARLGRDPFSTYLTHDVSKFSGRKLELNQWATLTIVGTARANTIYLNGEKIGESNNQMLCPLRWIGSTTGNSFVGKIRRLTVINRALSANEISRASGARRAE